VKKSIFYIALAASLLALTVSDPVGQGLIPSLTQPRGNITGLASLAAELGGKRLEILTEVMPKTTRASEFLREDGAEEENCN
jgi:putative ABC transport system substrate-binding protein